MERIKIQVADNRVYGLLYLYDLHTGLLAKALEGIPDDAAHNRLETKANHIAWLTGSLVQQRFELARHVGIEKQQAAFELFRNNKGIEDETSYPSLDSFQTDWHAVSPFLRDALTSATTETLDREIDMGEMKMSFFELLGFIIYREANIIGQIALWRRLLGYPAMKYM